MWIGAALLAITASAFGENDTAKAHFDAGRELLAAGKPAAACAEFGKSIADSPSVGAYLNLGECNQQQSKIASAKRAFDDAGALAATEGDEDRARFANKRSAKLAARLSYLRIVVPAELGERGAVVITVDGTTISDADYDKLIPADIGAHRITAAVDGVQRFKSDISIERERQEISVEIATKRPAKEQTSSSSPRPLEASSRSARSPALALSLGAGAAVSAGLATYFGLSARSRWNDARACEETRCTSEDAALADSARTRGHLSTALFALAAAGAGASVWLYVRGGSDGDRSSESPVNLEVGPGTVSLSGRF